MEELYSISNLGKLIAGFGEIAFSGKVGTEKEAFELAEADMSRRAKGHNEEIKNKCIDQLKVIFETFDAEYLPAIKQETSHEKRQEKFDEWHRNSCFCLRDTMSSGSFDGTYGRAQKVINMAFKYLFCCEEFQKKYQDCFKYCHMPLDSFTLEWFKREFSKDHNTIKWPESEKGKKLKAGMIASWSTLKYDLFDNPEKNAEDNKAWYYIKGNQKFYSYRFYYENIRGFIEDNKNKYTKEPGDVLSPLALEFIEWPKIQARLAAEAFLSELKEALYYKGNLSIKQYKEYLSKKDDTTLDSRIEQVSKTLKELDY